MLNNTDFSTKPKCIFFINIWDFLARHTAPKNSAIKQLNTIKETEKAYCFAKTLSLRAKPTSFAPTIIQFVSRYFLPKPPL